MNSEFHNGMDLIWNGTARSEIGVIRVTRTPCFTIPSGYELQKPFYWGHCNTYNMQITILRTPGRNQSALLTAPKTNSNRTIRIFVQSSGRGFNLIRMQDLIHVIMQRHSSNCSPCQGQPPIQSGEGEGYQINECVHYSIYKDQNFILCIMWLIVNIM